MSVSTSITGVANMDLETLDSKMARGLTNIVNGGVVKGVPKEQDTVQERHSRMLVGRQIANMIYSHFKVSDVQRE